jgi:hypothetical protein
MALEGRFFCYGCELWYGAPDAPLLPSQLCAGCKGAGARTPIDDQRVSDVNDDANDSKGED